MMSHEPYNPWKAGDVCEWIYERPEGDIVVYARNKAEAAATIRNHGFLVVNPEKIKQGTAKLTDHLKKDGIS